jgi:putative SOS response-associated peptidase YedK
LLPSWVKDPKAFTLLINARGESVLEKPAFRNAMKRRRCLFPADGFYEWKADGNRKVPFFARPVNDGPIAFAGLWETWIGPNGEEIETAAIVTTQANRTMGVVHHRAPVIVSAEAFDLWIDCANVDAATAAAMIAPAPEGLMAIHEISPAVNRVANDSPDLLTPVTAKELASADQLAPAAAAVDPPKAPGRQKRKADTRQGSLF